MPKPSMASALRCSQGSGEPRMNATARSSTAPSLRSGGPLLVVDDVTEVGLGRGGRGPPRVRRGAARRRPRHRPNLAVVEVLEGTAGLRPGNVRVSFSGAPMSVPVGEAWLGRMCNGRGEPIDGGPPVIGSESRPVAGRPINLGGASPHGLRS